MLDRFAADVLAFAADGIPEELWRFLRGRGWGKEEMRWAASEVKRRGIEARMAQRRRVR
jgi:hypothetical protein